MERAFVFCSDGKSRDKSVERYVGAECVMNEWISNHRESESISYSHQQLLIHFATNYEGLKGATKYHATLSASLGPLSPLGIANRDPFSVDRSIEPTDRTFGGPSQMTLE
jgi:hypothetical protein